MLRTTDGYVLKALDKLNTAKSFSVTVSGRSTKNDCGHDSPFLFLSNSAGTRKIIFQKNYTTFEIWILVSGNTWLKMSHVYTSTVDDFSLTFVQNVEARQWIFFFNGQKIDDRTIIEGSFDKVWAFSVFLERSDDAVHSYLSLFAS